MSRPYKHLECSKHLCRKIAEVFKFGDYNLLLPLISLKKVDNSNCIALNIPVKSLQSILNRNDVSALLDIKSGLTISQVHEDCNDESVSFLIKKETFTKSVLEQFLNYSSKDLGPDKKSVLVEFSSPNIAKPFHMGHLRSTIIGNFVANIMETTHYVKRLNYLGDWGTQIGFVKAGLEASKVSDVNLLKNPMKEMQKAYALAYNDPNMMQKARDIFSQLESRSSGDWVDQWEKIRQLTIEHLKETYKSFDIAFDDYSFESDYRTENLSPLIKILNENQMTTLDHGCIALHINGEKVPLFKSDGTSLYLVRDIAAALDRMKKYKCDKMLYVVDKSQTDHLNRLKLAVSKITQMDIVGHVPFGRITGMSTRKGTGIFLDDILNETIQKMSHQQLKSPNTRTTDSEITKVLGVTALIVYILRQRRNRDFNFSWEHAMQGTGDSGIKMQYTHCRLYSLQKQINTELPEEVDASALKEDVSFNLIFELARHGEVLQRSHENLESSYLVAHLFKLCNAVSKCLKELHVKGQPSDLAAQRMLLFNSARSTISSTMKTLGLKPLNEM